MIDKELTQAFRDAKAVLDHKRRTGIPSDPREKLEQATGAKIEIEEVDRDRDEVVVTLACLVQKETGGLRASRTLFCQGHLQVRVQFPQADGTAETVRAAWNETQLAFSECLEALSHLQRSVLLS